MKRIATGIVLALILALSTTVFAAYDPGGELPLNSEEVVHWEWDEVNQKWDQLLGIGLARAYRSGDKDGNFCNGPSWETDLTFHASIAHWCRWKLDHDRIDWRVLKPGPFIANCLALHISSNQEVQLNYVQGFGPLEYKGDTGDLPSNAKLEIPISYAWWLGDVLPTSNQLKEFIWRAVGDSLQPWENDLISALNEGKVPIGNGTTWGWTGHLYNKIVVDETNASCEYENSGIIEIKIVNQKNWVDPCTSPG
jgi:hypothetical protein